MATTLFQTMKLDMEQFLNRSERGDAELLAKLFVDQMLFDHTEHSWYLWRGAYWESDRTGEAFGKLDVIASEYLSAASEARAKGNKDLSEKFAKRASALLTNSRMKSVLDIASRLSEFAFDGNQWDADAMMLPVANGIVNLHDGKLYTSEPQNYIRTFCPVDWKGLYEPAPLWEKTLCEIFDSSQDLIAFVSRWFGYSITGETKEQKIPFFEGGGSNGKGVIMDTIMSVLGNGFCVSVQSEVLMDLRQSDSNAAKPFVVSLRNKRLVFASETKEQQKLNTGLVKQLTGDGYITARTLHEKPITFKQTYKIVLITNHLPAIPNSEDYAIWRRVLRVPFSVCFKEAPDLTNNERPIDLDLAEKLKSEYSGILAWLVRGCLEWQKQGLTPPDVITKSTKDYQIEEDLVSQFCTECIRKDPNKYILAGALYVSFEQWCQSGGDTPISNKAFAKKVTKLYGKTVSKRVNGKPQKVYAGIDWVP